MWKIITPLGRFSSKRNFASMERLLLYNFYHFIRLPLLKCLSIIRLVLLHPNFRCEFSGTLMLATFAMMAVTILDSMLHLTNNWQIIIIQRAFFNSRFLWSFVLNCTAHIYIMEKDYYHILDIPKTATALEISHSYRK